MPRRIQSYLLDGPAGKLEALLEEPGDGARRAVALVCHPHPLYGGTMHSKVVYRVARGLRHAGAVVLRFNFRGVGRSQGEHAHGAGEIEDARAALAWLRERYPDLPVILAGFSFGSRVILQLGCSLPEPPGILIALGFPARGSTRDWRHCRAPKVFVQSTRDEHGPRADMERVYAAAADPKQLIWIDAADHFFTGALDSLEERIQGLVAPVLALGSA